ncbi:hypothetical protein JL720_15839 [Aureococcus anophagefferens]|nr:hypothetical protein JL720_15839 [Aureococcus anophagefferens]
MINPHNPDFITKRPWYLGDSGPSLQHHDTRGAATASEVSMAEADAHLRRRRGAGTLGGGAVAVVEVRLDGSLDLEFENGRTSQKVPRAHAELPKAGAGARAGLESLGKVAYDAKRDRWHGYDPSMHKETEDRYAELDAARARRKDKRQDARSKEARAAAKAERKQAKAAQKAAGGGDDDDDSDSDSDSDDSDDEGDDEFRLDDAGAGDFQKRIARQGGVGGAQMKTTAKKAALDREKQQAILDKYGAQDVDEDAAERQLRRGRSAGGASAKPDARATSRGRAPPEARVQGATRTTTDDEEFLLTGAAPRGHDAARARSDAASPRRGRARRGRRGDRGARWRRAESPLPSRAKASRRWTHGTPSRRGQGPRGHGSPARRRNDAADDANDKKRYARLHDATDATV